MLLLTWILASLLLCATRGDRVDFVVPEPNATYVLAADQVLPVVFNVTRTDATPFNLSAPVGFVLTDLIDVHDGGHVVLALESLNASTSFFVSFDTNGTFSLAAWHISEENVHVDPGTPFFDLSGDLELLQIVSPFHVVVVDPFPSPTVTASAAPPGTSTADPVFSGTDTTTSSVGDKVRVQVATVVVLFAFRRILVV